MVENEKWTKENFAIVIGSTFTMGYRRKNIGDFARFLVPKNRSGAKHARESGEFGKS